MKDVNRRRKVGLVAWVVVLIGVVNMTKEVLHARQACLQAVNGQNTLVHLERSIIIIVSVKCHSGKSLGNGKLEEHHPKKLIQQETVSSRFCILDYLYS